MTFSDKTAIHKIFLLADIGGTHLRFCLSQPDGSLTIPRIFQWPKSPDLPLLIQDYLASEPNGAAAQDAVLACAGPEPTGDQLFMFNVGREAGLLAGYTCSLTELKRRCGFQSLKVVNDYRTVALSLSVLKPDDLHKIGSGAPQNGSPKAVVGPGTGYNSGALVFDGEAEYAMVGESGHGVLAPIGEREMAVARYFETRFPPYAWVEKAVSGTGIREIYKALCALDGGTQADTELALADIRTRAIEGSCSICHEALSLFCLFLGTEAANTALRYGARGGVYIAGGVVPRMIPFLEASGFRGRFESIATHIGFLKNIPTYVITHPTASLLGAQKLAYQAEQQNER